MAALPRIDEGVTDDVIAEAISNFTKLSERRGIPRLEREAFSGLALMLTLQQRDHAAVSQLKERVDVLEKRNIISWVINHPKVAIPIIALLLIDLFSENMDTLRALLGIQ